jgi:2-hydroxycyclohexanecarboxyl-CoA dehydrogenase
MDLELVGHVAVVTGGASGIGLACARAMTREGCRVAVWDLARDAAASLGLVVDVSEFAAVEAAVEQTEAALGPIAHVVHAAALGSGKFGFPFTNLTKPADWPRVLEVNVMGMVHVAQAIAPGMNYAESGHDGVCGIGRRTDRFTN